MKKIICRLAPGFSVSLLVLLMGCTKTNSGGSSLYTPTSSDVTATATLAELQQGRTLYMNRCNSCHSLYSPDDYNSTQWKSIMSNMGPRSGMSAADILLVTKYVSRGN
jgi:hypothetical protein